jgi:hypothetical protein
MRITVSQMISLIMKKVTNMRRIYVIIGELEDTDKIDHFEAAYPTMEEADAVCTELESTPGNNHIWYWREVILVEEGDER